MIVSRCSDPLHITLYWCCFAGPAPIVERDFKLLFRLPQDFRPQGRKASASHAITCRHSISSSLHSLSRQPISLSRQPTPLVSLPSLTLAYHTPSSAYPSRQSILSLVTCSLFQSSAYPPTLVYPPSRRPAPGPSLVGLPFLSPAHPSR